MTPARSLPLRLLAAPLCVIALAACSMAFEPPSAHAATPTPDWPPAWADVPDAQQATDFTPPRFSAPAASHCHRAPSTREVPGRDVEPQASEWPRRRGDARTESAASALAERMPGAKVAAATGRVAGALTASPTTAPSCPRRTRPRRPSRRARRTSW